MNILGLAKKVAEVEHDLDRLEANHENTFKVGKWHTEKIREMDDRLDKIERILKSVKKSLKKWLK